MSAHRAAASAPAHQRANGAFQVFQVCLDRSGTVLGLERDS
jgi:hypothetical protein